MKYCWNKNRNKFTTVIAWIMLCGMLIYWIQCAIKSINEWNWPLWFSIPIFSVGISYGVLYFFIIVAHERKYHVDKAGLTVGYPCGIIFFHPWVEISEVAICNVHYSKKGPVRYDVAIRIVIGTETSGPKQAKRANERWSEEIYEVQHFGKIISIENSDSRLDEIKAVCPLPIIDYRHLPGPM